jgi:EAL domain-containing protein (putative c-di-GMP-specific phosphodiesterase class I)
MNKLLDTILHENQLQAVFQPIVSTSDLNIVGYEALIRGPMGSELELPTALFGCARSLGRQSGPELDEVLLSLEMEPTRVVIEITEEQAVTDYPRLHDVARRLSALGYEWAIDDLGAGYASLRLWLELQPACVKLDNAFVQGSDGDALKRCFLNAVQQLASCSQARVIAEGVETAQELEVLRRLGIAYAQGYYIARPSAKPPLRIDLS